MQADTLLQGTMDFPTDNASLAKVHGTYRGLLGQVAVRHSRFIAVRIPSAQGRSN